MAALLSENQVGRVVSKINAKFNVPFVSESSEGQMIKEAVDALNVSMEPALRSIIPPDYVQIIKLCLDETLSPNQKLPMISDILKTNLSEPLTDALNREVDIPAVPEFMEKEFLKMAVDEIIEESVEQTLQRFTDTEVSD